MSLLFTAFLIGQLLMSAEAQVCITESTTTSTTTAAPTTCPTGWTLFQSYCYQFFNTPVVASVAINNCHALGAQLASVHSFAENDFLYNLSGMRSIWISLVRIGTGNTDFTNSDGTAVDYTNWFPGEPNLAGLNEYCVDLRGIGPWSPAAVTRWNDTKCFNNFYYVCKMPL